MMKPLERDHSCMKHLAFRMDLVSPSASATLRAIALELGFVESRPIAGLSKLVCAEGHEILLVERTGRAQLRVSYMVPHERRRAVAEDVYCRIARILVGRGANDVR